MCYDKKAEQFYKDTNIWPIGKDRPIGQIPDTEYDVRIRAYKYWRKVQQCLNQHDSLVEAAKEVINVVKPSKLKGTIRDNFSEQNALAQLSKALAQGS